MNVVSVLKDRSSKDCKIAGIDASSTSIAIAIVEKKADEIKLLHVYKISLQGIDMQRKLRIISAFFAFFEEYHRDLDEIFIEQPIYIQNPATSRILSQVSGHIWGKCLENCRNVSEVIISNWKSYIGYKNVSKAEKEAWTKELGAKESKKMAASERKARTIRIIHEKIPNASHIDDNDICDSIGIALWGLNKRQKGA